MRAGSGHVELIGQKWYLRLRETNADGVKSQHRVTLGGRRDFRSTAGARAAADAWIARQSPSTLEPGPVVTFGEYAQRFILDHLRLNKKTSRKRVESNIKLLERYLGSERLSDIDAVRLQGVITELSQQKAPATMRTIRTVALQILRQARADKYGAHIIESRSIRLPKQTAPRKEKSGWTNEQLELILSASRGQWRVLWFVMAYAGLRIGEALGLCWRDIDFDRKLIFIRRAACQGELVVPKTLNSEVAVPLLVPLEECLRGYLDMWRSNDMQLMFPNTKGGVARADDVRTRKLRPILAGAGLPRFGLHSFRHTTTRLLMNLGVGPDVVRLFMRHGSLRTTEGYMHTTAVDMRAAIDAATFRTNGSQQPTAGTGL